MAPTRPVVLPPPLAGFNTIGRWGHHRGGRAVTVALSGVELLRATTIGRTTKGNQVWDADEFHPKEREDTVSVFCLPFFVPPFSFFFGTKCTILRYTKRFRYTKKLRSQKFKEIPLPKSPPLFMTLMRMTTPRQYSRFWADRNQAGLFGEPVRGFDLHKRISHAPTEGHFR